MYNIKLCIISNYKTRKFERLFSNVQKFGLPLCIIFTSVFNQINIVCRNNYIFFYITMMWRLIVGIFLLCLAYGDQRLEVTVFMEA